MLEEEPSGAYYESATVTTKMQNAYDRFLARKAAIAKVRGHSLSSIITTT